MDCLNKYQTILSNVLEIRIISNRLMLLERSYSSNEPMNLIVMKISVN